MPKLVFDRMTDPERDFHPPELEVKTTESERQLLRYSPKDPKRMVLPKTHRPVHTPEHGSRTMEDMNYIYMDAPVDKVVSVPYVRSDHKIENKVGGIVPVEMKDTSRFQPLSKELTAYLHDRAFMGEGYFKFLRTNDAIDILTGDILLEHTYVHATTTPDHVPRIHTQNLQKDMTDENFLRSFLRGQDVIVRKTTTCALSGVRLEKGEIPLTFFDPSLVGMRKAFFLHISIRVGYVKERINLPTKRRDPDQDLDYHYDLDGLCSVCTGPCEDTEQERLMREFEVEEPLLFRQFMALMVADIDGVLQNKLHASLEKKLKENKRFQNFDYTKHRDEHQDMINNCEEKKDALELVMRRMGCFALESAETYPKMHVENGEIFYELMQWRSGSYDTRNGNLEPFEQDDAYDEEEIEDDDVLPQDLAVLRALMEEHAKRENKYDGPRCEEEEENTEEETLSSDDEDRYEDRG